MKILQVKFDGQWREVIYVREGRVDMYKGEDGMFADFELEPNDEHEREKITIRSIQDIRLVKESEDEIETIYFGLNREGQFIIDEDDKKGKYTTDDRFSQLIYKINELVNAVNQRFDAEEHDKALLEDLSRSKPRPLEKPWSNMQNYINQCKQSEENNV